MDSRYSGGENALACVIGTAGHVDHGKTTLVKRLTGMDTDRLKEEKRRGVSIELGFAFMELTGDIRAAIVDVPGHERFIRNMLSGATGVDLVLFCVAADDGVMPQTVEAINHARAAGVPIIVAINKIDKENAEPEKVQRELAEEGLLPEDWGGETIFVPVSAKTHEGLDDLLEMVLLQAEMLELKA
ncbi:MAG: GTP-binding protein, partial [Deltaproteobacteria bacterium]|nr:GTP-binding protein [Deltaproteobacteria bacterium]